MPKRVFATCDIGPALDRLRQLGYELDVYPEPAPPPKAVIVEKIRSGIDGLICTLRDRLDEEVFAAAEAAGKLKVVAQMAVGVDNIDRASATRHGIPFTNTPDVLTEATAEYAFFIMGMLSRRMWTAEHITRDQQWGFWHPSLPFLGDEVTGKTVAIIGTGRIGLAMARKCSGFDMNILCYSPKSRNEKFVAALHQEMDLRFTNGLVTERHWIKYVSFDEALAQADFVSVHVPLLREGESATPTLHMFNETTLRQMKPTAYLINTARGPVIDEAALAEALRQRWIAGAGLDVYENEPLPADSPLRDPGIEDRCRLLPHHGSQAQLTRLSADPDLGMAGRCVQALIDVLEGNYNGDLRLMPWVVNKEVAEA